MVPDNSLRPLKNKNEKNNMTCFACGKGRKGKLQNSARSFSLCM
jgi:hypothetical protein